MISELFKRAETPEDAKALLAQVYKSFRGPATVSRETLVGDMRLVTIACVKPSEYSSLLALPKNPTMAAFVESNLSDRVMEACVAKIDKFMSEGAGESTGSFIPKIPNPVVQRGAMFGEPGLPSEFSDHPFVSSRTLKAVRRTVAWSKNARYLAAGRFLRTSLVLDGKVVSMAEAIATDAGIRTALVEAGWPYGSIENVGNHIRKSMEGPDDTPLDRELKVILFPISEGDYAQVTPLAASSVFTELHLRINDGYADPEAIVTYARRKRTVGGSNARNVAIEVMDAGGKVETLVSMPPPPRAMEPLSRLLHRVKTTKSAIGKPFLSKGLTEAIRAMAEAPSNVHTRTALTRVLSAAAYIMLSGPLTLSEIEDDERRAGFASHIKDPIEAALVVGGPDTLNGASLFALADRLGHFVAASATDDDDVLALFVGSDFRDLLHDAVKATFEGDSPSEAEIEQDAETAAQEPEEEGETE